MAFTISDKGEPVNNIQSILFQEYLDVLIAGQSGTDCVISGLAISTNSNMTLAIAKGAVLSNKVLKPVTQGNVTVTAADATNPRIDLIVVDSTGAKAVRAGTAAAAPKPPARTANDVVLYAVYVAANDTNLQVNETTDLRVTPSFPLCIYKLTTAVAHNTDVAIFSYMTVTIPDGSTPAGTIMRVRCGGTYLYNAATQPTPILNINYGGSAMWVDTGLLSTADADRGAWYLDFQIVFQAANDEQLIGFGIMTNTLTGAHVPPTTGQAGNLVGSLAVANRPVSFEMAAALAVDSAVADRTIDIRWTMGGSASASNEITIEFGTVEIL